MSGSNPSGTQPPAGRASPKAIAAATAVVLLWASAFVAVKVALDEFSPGQLALSRFVVASFVFLVIAVFRAAFGARLSIPPPADLLRLALAGLIGISVYNLALNTGQQTVSAGVASLLVNTVPIWASLFSVVLLGERIGRRGWLGTVVSFAGVAVIGLHKAGWTGFQTGTLLVLAAAVSQALYFVIVRPLLKRYHPLDLTSYVVWFGCLFLVPFQSGLVEALQQGSARTLVAIVFLGVGPAALAYVAWSYVLAELDPGKASNVLFLVPVAALALGWLVLREVPSLVALLGGATAICGVLLSKGLFKRPVAPAVACRLDPQATGAIPK